MSYMVKYTTQLSCKVAATVDRFRFNCLEPQDLFAYNYLASLGVEAPLTNFLCFSSLHICHNPLTPFAQLSCGVAA